ncbi:MAG: aspartate carbamoyltransferase catalytic subunit [Candidatus Eremiobacteraeota bacterium]|uniref:aspartate carbamoyltransferase n=1 Tax=mine drainage metagenome TaxID=410659 RepID=E6PDU8_9ZZZZ|nr:aspartate carbamoyltransferase catalytic subunit [Candidatus Eremiobacteraeota bacterium]
MTTTRSLLDIDDLTNEEIDVLFALAREFAQRPAPRSLDGRFCANLFFEQSTRTHVSFQCAQLRLGGNVVNLTPAQLSLATKGERLDDTAVTLRALGIDVLVARHPLSGAVAELAAAFDGCTVNAGDGTNAHPTQALLDTFTLRDLLDDLRGRTIAFVGDIRHSRVAHSSMRLLRRYGATVLAVGPEGFLTDADVPPDVEIVRDFDGVLRNIDALVMLRVQRERFEKMPMDDAAYIAAYQLDDARLARLGARTPILHPGPYNRGVEIVDAVTLDARWRYREQVRNGVLVRASLLHHLVRGW